jgi:hypothetical protein
MCEGYAKGREYSAPRPERQPGPTHPGMALIDGALLADQNS